MSTPRGILSSVDDDDELIGYREIAAMDGTSEATLRGYKRRGQMPEPDDTSVPDRPRWRRGTIRTWLAGRLGRGAPGQPRKRGTTNPDE